LAARERRIQPALSFPPRIFNGKAIAARQWPLFVENGRHFPIFVLIAFSAFAQPTLISFSWSLRHPINLPPPGEIPGHSRATSDLQYDKGSAASAVRAKAGNAITPSESNATGNK